MNESDDFRDRLIRAQKMSPEFEGRYREQVSAIVNLRLTPNERRMNVIGAVWFAVAGLFLFLIPAIRIAAPDHPRGLLVGAVFIVWSAYFAWTAARGRYDPRTQPAIAGALSLVIPIIVAVTLAPGSQREIRDYVVAMAIALLILLFVLAIKLIRMDYRLKEKMLDLDYRVAELSERL